MTDKIFPPGEPPAAAQPATEQIHERSIPLLRKTLLMLCHFIWYRQTRPGEHMWSIPVDKERDFDCIIGDAIDELEQLRALSLHPHASAVQPAPHDGIRNDEASERKLQELAFGFHVGIEGEYGCPGISCPGVQRLVEKLRELKGVGRFDYVPPAAVVSPREEPKQ